MRLVVTSPNHPYACAGHVARWVENDGEDERGEHAVQSQVLQHHGLPGVGVVLRVTNEEAHDEGVDQREDEQHSGRSLEVRRDQNHHLVNNAPNCFLGAFLRW